MKKFLTVLLALSVVFTYSFSAVGSAFAATDKGELTTAVNVYKSKAFGYAADAEGTMFVNGLETMLSTGADGWDGKISKAVLDATTDKWVNNVELSKVDYVENTTKELSNAGVSAYAKYLLENLVKAQYDAYHAEWETLTATIEADLVKYNDAGKTTLTNALKTSRNTVSGAKGINSVSPKTITQVTDIKAEIGDLKSAVKEQKSNLLTEEAAQIAKDVAAMQKSLDENAEAYYLAVMKYFDTNPELSVAEQARKDSFNEDFNAVVAAMNEFIVRYETEKKAGKTPTDNLNAERFSQLCGWYLTSKVSANNPTLENSYFQNAVKLLAEKDVLITYYDKQADKAKKTTNASGTLKYHAADVDQLLVETKDALNKDVWVAFEELKSTVEGEKAAATWTKGLEAIANKQHDLHKYREDAIKTFTENAYDAKNWSDARRDKVEAIQAEYTEKVFAAATVADIDALVKEAKAAIDKIMTTNEVNAIANKAAQRLITKGFLATCKIKTGTGIVETANSTAKEGFGGYYDTQVNPDKKYNDAKADALVKAAQVIVDAVLAEENDSIALTKVDEIILANMEAARAAMRDVKSDAELKAEAEAVATLIKALPTVVTAADKEQVLAAQAAMDAYMANAGAKQNKVTGYQTLQTALTAVLSADKKAAEKLILGLPTAVAIDDANAINAARDAYDAYMDAAEAYNPEFATAPAFNQYYTDKLEKAEAALEKAKIDYTADLITKLTDKSSKAEVLAAKAAFDDLQTKSKLHINEDLRNKLFVAVGELTNKDIAAVKSFKIKTTTKRYDGKKMRVNWTVTGDESAIDGYRIYFSTKKTNSGYKYLAKTTKHYINHTSIKTNKSVKKGQRVFYRVRAYVEIDGVRYFSDYSNPGNRIWK